MQCKQCGGEMTVINASSKMSRYIRRRRQCSGCKRKVTTFESVYDPATGELAEHLITMHLTYTPENLITAFRSLPQAGREIVLELAQSDELPFNSPTLVNDIKEREAANAKAVAAVDTTKSVDAGAGEVRVKRKYKKRGPRSDEQKAATAALKKANAERRVQESEPEPEPEPVPKRRAKDSEPAAQPAAQPATEPPKQKRPILTAKSVMKEPAAVDDEIAKLNAKHAKEARLAKA